MQRPPSSNDRILPRPSALKEYADAGWSFVKLHRFDEKRKLPPTKKNPEGRILDLGKAPMGKAWVKAGVPLKDAVTHMNGGMNVGALVPTGWAVIDVDPRNFKGEDNSFDRLTKDVALDLTKYAMVKTGSGGWHIFVRIPAGWKGIVKIEAYPGVEFKTIGSQVVTAGSIHPVTKQHYVWQDSPVSMAESGEAPEAMLKLYKMERPLISGQQGGDTWGSLTIDQVEEGLALLDPLNYQTQDDWFGLMCSVHWLSGGDARQQWTEWSAQDPEYADRSGEVATRWDSLGRASASPHMVARGGQFFKALKGVGVEAHDARFGISIERSFRDVAPEEFEDDLKSIERKNEAVRETAYRTSNSIVESMNEKHFVLNYRGKTVIAHEGRNDAATWPPPGSPKARLFRWSRWCRVTT